jgi:hypothetical protein
MLNHPTSSTLVSNWPNPSWIHQHLVIKHDPCLVRTLLSNITLAWFTPLLEHQLPLLNDFDAIFKEINATFRDLDKECISTNKLQSFCQGLRLASMYAFGL